MSTPCKKKIEIKLKTLYKSPNVSKINFKMFFIGFSNLCMSRSWKVPVEPSKNITVNMIRWGVNRTIYDVFEGNFLLKTILNVTRKQVPRM